MLLCLLLTPVKAQNILIKGQADSCYQKAIELYEQGKRREGLEYLNKAIGLEPDNYDALYARSYYAIEEGNYTQAIKDYNLLLRIYPDVSALYLYRGNAYFYQTNYEQAEEDFLTAYELDSTSTEVCNALGSLYYTLDLPEDALNYLNQSLKLEPKNNIDAYYYKASVNQALKKYDIALQDIEQALKIAPQDTDLQRLKASIWLDMQKYEQAIAIFEQFEQRKVELTEEDFLLWGKSYYKQKQWDKAIYYWETPENHENVPIWQHIAKSYYYKNNFKKALESIEKALQYAQKQSLNLAELYYDRACIQHKLKNKTAAEQDLQQAISLMPEITQLTNDRGETLEVLENLYKTWQWERTQKTLVDSLKVRGFMLRAEYFLKEKDGLNALKAIENGLAIQQTAYLYMLKGMLFMFYKEPQKALQEYEKALALPSDMTQKAKILHAQSLAYSDLAQYAQAINTIEDAIKKIPNIPNNYGSLAVYYSLKAHIHTELNQVEQALESINKALQLDNNNTDFYVDRALVYAEKQEFDKALQDAEKALRLDTNNALAYYSRAIAYEGLKKYSEAASDYAQVLNMNNQNEEVKERLNRVLNKMQSRGR